MESMQVHHQLVIERPTATDQKGGGELKPGRTIPDPFTHY